MIKYFVKSRKNPIDKTTKFYAQIASPEPIDVEAIARRIAANCTLTRHDILACLSAFQEQLIYSLQEGKSVRLSDLGSFRVTLRSQGTDTAEEFNSGHIEGMRIRFTPAARLRKSISVGADGVSLSVVDKTTPGGADSPTEKV